MRSGIAIFGIYGFYMKRSECKRDQIARSHQTMKSDFGRYIDHTLLRPIGTTNDIRRLCSEAIEYGMAAVCIFPSYVPWHAIS